MDLSASSVDARFVLYEWLKPVPGFVIEAPRPERASLGAWSVGVATSSADGHAVWTGTVPLVLDGSVSGFIADGLRMVARTPTFKPSR